MCALAQQVFILEDRFLCLHTSFEYGFHTLFEFRILKTSGSIGHCDLPLSAALASAIGETVRAAKHQLLVGALPTLCSSATGLCIGFRLELFVCSGYWLVLYLLCEHRLLAVALPTSRASAYVGAFGWSSPRAAATSLRGTRNGSWALARFRGRVRRFHGVCDCN